jgi:biopolymer transport protein ExbD
MKIGHSGGHKHRKHQSMPMAEINIIPLVDITLVLLIIFMATTAFVKEAGLNMKLPAAKTTDMSSTENKDLSVALSRDGSIYLDGKPSSEAAIQSAMLAAAARNPETRVVIKGDENIEYKRVVSVMDMARQAGLPKVALGTRLPDSP